MEEELNAAVRDGSIVSIVEDARRYSRPFPFWAMMPLIWDKRNVRRPLSVMAYFAIAMGLYAMLYGLYLALFHGNFVGLLSVPVGYLIAIVIGTSPLSERIENHHDQKYFLLRCWLIFESYKAGGVIDSIPSLSRALESYHTPVPRDHYALRHEQLRRLKKPMLLVFAGIMALFLGAMLLQFTQITGPYIFYPLLFLMCAGMFAAGAADIYEQYYRPVLFKEFADEAEDALRHGLGVDVDEMIRAFDSRAVFMRIKFKAVLGYVFGILSGWNIWTLAEPAMCLVLLAMYVAIPFYVSPTSLPLPYGVLIGLVLGLFAYSVIQSWYSGGGYRKAMNRKRMLAHVFTSFSLGELMSVDIFREMVASASYDKEVSDATEVELLTRMVVESSTSSFR